jgi:hypothetical protein
MGLPGLHIVETGLARLATFWPASRGHVALPAFRAVRVAVDAAALSRANAIYSGTLAIEAPDFVALDWLDCFARSGRQLLMCHALRLLEGWNNQRRATQSLQVETRILRRIAEAAAAFADTLDSDLLLPLQHAFVAQHQRVLGQRCHSPVDKLEKALSLLGAARATQQTPAMVRDAMPLLDQALTHLIHNDGGPTEGSLTQFVEWTSLLLQSDDLPMSPMTRKALDRTRPFLAMLLGADQTYCLEDTLPAALPGQTAGSTSLQLSSHGRGLLSCGLFLHDGTEDQCVTRLSSEASPQGQLLEQVTGHQRRTVFVSPKGDDIRIEDELPGDGLTRWLSLTVHPEARISVARQGTQATIALGGRNLWQLTWRGARLLPQQQDNRLIAEASPHSPARVNWALKRIDRTSSRSEKPDVPELPFDLDIVQRNG